MAGRWQCPQAFWQMALFRTCLAESLLNTNSLSNGSGGMGKARTCWDLSLTLGIPFSR
jgi:hypothetical protein